MGFFMIESVGRVGPPELSAKRRTEEGSPPQGFDRRRPRAGGERENCGEGS